MTCNRELTVVPWTAYISHKLHLPILMHQPVQDVMTSLLSESAVGRKYLLVDVISSLYSSICNVLSPGMFGFAFDVAAAYGDRKHFVEGTQEAVVRTGPSPVRGCVRVCLSVCLSVCHVCLSVCLSVCVCVCACVCVCVLMSCL